MLTNELFAVQPMTDTSDQAYLARHKRFEGLEKRQRLREKEKILHERYKLKERIDQLRAMPPQTFLPDEPAPPLTHDQIVEGERARRELLREAEELERRYDLLLSNHRDHHVEEARPPPSLTIKVRLGSTGTRTPPVEGTRTVNFAGTNATASNNANHTTSARNRPAKTPARPRTTSRSKSPDSPRSKRPRHSAPAEALSYAEIESQLAPGYVPDILRIAAPTNASRIPSRTILPFGVKAPTILDEQSEFELPLGIQSTSTPNPRDTPDAPSKHEEDPVAQPRSRGQ
ncbi:hypothetical protein DL93DRAFT_33808 [Clavulina sp. PMI_390]|nr:hypothetical protein DL93DRAFT_33808 [Clavulina sp. PMI_390]